MKTYYIEDFVNSRKLAVVDDGDLVDLIIEKNDASVRIKDIYAGRVERVLPGMEACFVEIGSDISGYLKLGQSSTLKVGDRVLVQVKKSDKENKRLSLDQEISLAGRGLVYIGGLKKPVFSKSIKDSSQRSRIRSILPSPEYLVRTRAQYMLDQDLIKEASILEIDYQDVLDSFKKNRRIGLLRPAQSMVLEYVGDNIGADQDEGSSDEIDRIVYSVYGIEEDFNKDLRAYLKTISSDLLLKLDKKKNTDIFEAYGINTRIGRLLSKRVDTEQGPYIIIDRTEALNIIDVNTGSFVGYSDYETTVTMANKIAAKEIVRQILMRDLSGIILVDFIDMKDKSARDSLIDIINQGLSEDERKFKVHGYTRLGLLEISRSRKSKSILDYYEDIDPKNLSRIKSLDSVIDEIERRVQIEVYHKQNYDIKLCDILYEYRLVEIEEIFKSCQGMIKKMEVRYNANIEK